MGEETTLYLDRAETELVAAEVLFTVSSTPSIQKEQFKIEKEFTFYSMVIGHAYYCIFYSAKAILLRDNIKTYSPDIHKKTIDAFATHLVNTGRLDVDLLKIYKKMILHADALFGIYSKERQKRGKFTYTVLPQTHMNIAQESLNNASLFFKSINKILR